MTADRTMPEPGPARDALVATLVMGWRYVPEGRNSEGTWHGSHWEEPLEFGGWMYARGAGDGRLGCWSTDKHAALDSLLHMQREGWERIAETVRGREIVTFHKASIRATSWDFGEGVDVKRDFADAVTAAAIRAKWAEEDAR